MERASRDTVIFSSEVRTQSSIPLQPFTGKLKLVAVLVGLLWMLSTVEKYTGSHQWVNNNKMDLIHGPLCGSLPC